MKSTTIREELVVALFDDAADIVKRLETLAPLMANTRHGLAEATKGLAAQVRPFRDQMQQIAAAEQYKAIHYVREQVEGTSRVAQELQIKALKEAGRAVLKEEVGTTLQKLIESIQEIVKQTGRRETFRIRLTTVVVSASITASLMLYLLPKH